jgi:mannosylglycerate hydrolase MGH1-like protein
MREWSLKPGDPLTLVISADARLGKTDYVNDHTWELDLGGGEPPALALRTTYGLRARSMRLFPRFIENGRAVANPAEFAEPPVVRRIYPNYLLVTFSVFPGVEVNAEYWVPSSQIVTGRLAIANRSVVPHNIQLEWVAQLLPLEGQPCAPIQMSSATVLGGRSNGLTPIVFVTGGPHAGPGPYPSLNIGLDLTPGLSRQISWAQTAFATPQESFEAARRTVARSFDGERGRIEMFNASQSVEIKTGDADWDAAFALSQTTASRLLMNGAGLPHLSFVQSRQPDQGFSQRGDGADYNHLWNGQTPIDAYYLASLLPGAPEIAKGLLRNFLAAQTTEGGIDCKPGLANQRSRFAATPILAALAWKIYEATNDKSFLAEVYPKLFGFFDSWFTPLHDRDGNGIPEWDGLLQTGFEDNPLFDAWHPWAQGVDITAVQSPTLAAMLYREAHALVRMAEMLGRVENVMAIRVRAGVLRAGIEATWNDERSFYQYTDRDTHLNLPGQLLSERFAEEEIKLKKSFDKPVRLLFRIKSHDTARRPDIVITGKLAGKVQTETLAKTDFALSAEGVVADSSLIYDGIGTFQIDGLSHKDRVAIQTVDLNTEDHTLFLPLWAGLPDAPMAETLVRKTLLQALRFNRPYGIPAVPGCTSAEAESICLGVYLPWNQFIGEGLLAYGYRHETARLLAHLMNAVIQSLKRLRGFSRTYHAETGSGLGERNPLAGLAPVGLFLQTLGVQFLENQAVRISGENPFPWPVTVKYKGLTVARKIGKTRVTFVDGRTISLTDPTNALVSAE